MVKQFVPTVKVFVVGDPGNGKANFINGFLHYYPPSAEVRRKNDTIHFMYKQDKNLKIQLHDVSSVKSIENHFYDDMNIVFFCYAANEPASFLSLEKWIRSIQTRSIKEMHSFLVADMSNVGSQRNTANRLAEKANELKEYIGIKRFIECSFVDKESTYSVLKTILDEVSPPKLNKQSPSKLYKESSEKLPKICLAERPPCSLLGSYLCKPRHPCGLDSQDRGIFDYDTLQNPLS